MRMWSYVVLSLDTSVGTAMCQLCVADEALYDGDVEAKELPCVCHVTLVWNLDAVVVPRKANLQLGISYNLTSRAWILMKFIFLKSSRLTEDNDDLRKEF